MTLGERIINDILNVDTEDYKYLNELLHLENYNKKQESDLFRFADLLSVIKHSEANTLALKAVEKIKNVDVNAINAKLNMFLDTDYEIDLNKLPFDRLLEYELYLESKNQCQ